MKIEAAGSSEILISISETARRHITEDLNLVKTECFGMSRIGTMEQRLRLRGALPPRLHTPMFVTVK